MNDQFHSIDKQPIVDKILLVKIFSGYKTLFTLQDVTKKGLPMQLYSFTCVLHNIPYKTKKIN